MKKLSLFIALMVLASLAWTQMGPGMGSRTPQKIYPLPFSQEDGAKLTELIRIARGGQLYDNWWKTTVDTEKPQKDHPLWKEQSTNTRRGYDTFRCKECHGWDYRGKDGAYGKGSHYTGFKGVHEASLKMSLEDLENITRGTKRKEHDYTGYLADDDLADLAIFIKKGLIDTTRLITDDGMPTGGNSRTGSALYRRNCTHMCHGVAGTAINFGDADNPEFVGTLANENPWEFMHKVRAGQPGTTMPSAIINEWSEKELLDLLAFSRTLPKDTTEIGWWRTFWGGFGHH
ncbi:MAG: cytochrome c, partial [Desulfomonilia bacterium]|nr:cytochrome c [Desulfomonilia bacterium]